MTVDQVVLVGWQKADILVDKIIQRLFEKNGGQVSYKSLERQLIRNIGYSYLIPTSRSSAEQLQELLQAKIYSMENGTIFQH